MSNIIVVTAIVYVQSAQLTLFVLKKNLLGLIGNSRCDGSDGDDLLVNC